MKTSTRVMLILAALFGVSALGACPAVQGSSSGPSAPGAREAPGPGPGGRPGEEPTEPPCHISRNDEIFQRLSPTCVGCHGAGTNKPFFASLTSFETLLVADPAYVVPGNPAASELVRLLEGTGTGSFQQMPLGEEPYARLADAQLPMEELRDWIFTLQVGVASEEPDAEAPTTRRLTAEEIVTTLKEQIGLTDDDDFIRSIGTSRGSPVVSLRGDLPVWSPDAAPAANANDAAESATRWVALGGPAWLDGNARSQEISPAFGQMLTQVSQAWCRMAAQKSPNPVFFRFGSLTSANVDDIKRNIGALHLRMLGEPPTSEDVDELYDEVFVVHRPDSAAAAWTAVCAALVRHPLWLSL
jgi:hypothetical protein